MNFLLSGNRVFAVIVLALFILSTAACSSEPDSKENDQNGDAGWTGDTDDDPDVNGQEVDAEDDADTGPSGDDQLELLDAVYLTWDTEVCKFNGGYEQWCHSISSDDTPDHLMPIGLSDDGYFRTYMMYWDEAPGIGDDDLSPDNMEVCAFDADGIAGCYDVELEEFHATHSVLAADGTLFLAESQPSVNPENPENRLCEFTDEGQNWCTYVGSETIRHMLASTDGGVFAYRGGKGLCYYEDEEEKWCNDDHERRITGLVRGYDDHLYASFSDPGDYPNSGTPPEICRLDEEGDQVFCFYIEEGIGIENFVVGYDGGFYFGSKNSAPFKYNAAGDFEWAAQGYGEGAEFALENYLSDVNEDGEVLALILGARGVQLDASGEAITELFENDLRSLTYKR